MSKRGGLTMLLLSQGWHRDNGPADLTQECGADTEISICHNSARWYKGAYGPLCAQHAAGREAYEKEAS